MRWNMLKKNCNPELLPAWIESYLLRGHENRHRFRIFSAINTFDHDMALNELKNRLPIGLSTILPM